MGGFGKDFIHPVTAYFGGISNQNLLCARCVVNYQRRI